MSIIIIIIVGVIDPVLYIYIYIYMLGRGPNPRTVNSLRTGKCCHGSLVLVNEEVRFGHKSPGRWSKEECLLGLAKQSSEDVVYHPG